MPRVHCFENVRYVPTCRNCLTGKSRKLAKFAKDRNVRQPVGTAASWYRGRPGTRQRAMRSYLQTARKHALPAFEMLVPPFKGDP